MYPLNTSVADIGVTIAGLKKDVETRPLSYDEILTIATLLLNGVKLMELRLDYKDSDWPLPEPSDNITFALMMG